MPYYVKQKIIRKQERKKNTIIIVKGTNPEIPFVSNSNITKSDSKNYVTSIM